MIILDFFCLISDCLGLVFYSLGVPGVSDGKESACNEGNMGSIPGLGRYPGKGNSYPLQYSGLENSMDCIVHGVAVTAITTYWALCQVIYTHHSCSPHKKRIE